MENLHTWTVLIYWLKLQIVAQYGDLETSYVLKLHTQQWLGSINKIISKLFIAQ